MTCSVFAEDSMMSASFNDALIGPPMGNEKTSTSDADIGKESMKKNYPELPSLEEVSNTTLPSLPSYDELPSLEAI